MRRSGYNSLNNSQDDETGDGVDSSNNEEEKQQPFAEASFEVKTYRKTLFLVFTLFFGGLTTLVTSTLILIGHLDNELYADRLIPLMILGILMFIPGAFYMRIVYFAYLGKPGFSYEQIPSCY